MEVLLSNHIFAEEEEEVPQVENAQETPASFEEGNQDMIDALK